MERQMTATRDELVDILDGDGTKQDVICEAFALLEEQRETRSRERAKAKRLRDREAIAYYNEAVRTGAITKD